MASFIFNTYIHMDDTKWVVNGYTMMQYIIFLLIKGGYFYLILVMTKANLIGFLII